jgi:hypothetical protein
VNPNATWSVSLESSYPHLQPQEVSKAPITSCTYSSLSKSVKNRFGCLMPLGVNNSSKNIVHDYKYSFKILCFPLQVIFTYSPTSLAFFKINIIIIIIKILNIWVQFSEIILDIPNPKEGRNWVSYYSPHFLYPEQIICEKTSEL